MHLIYIGGFMLQLGVSITKLYAIFYPNASYKDSNDVNENQIGILKNPAKMFYNALSPQDPRI